MRMRLGSRLWQTALFTLPLLLLGAAGARAAITGTVFQDYNADGVRNTVSSAANPAIDRGIAGVTVTAFDATGAPVATTSSCGTVAAGVCTGTNPGFYSLAVPGAGPFRVEFTGLPATYSPGGAGANSGTGVQFVPGANAANVDFGINRGPDFCQANPPLIATLFTGGDLLAGPNANEFVVVDFEYRAGNSSSSLVTGPGGHDDSGFGVEAHTVFVPGSQVGSVYGVAYRRRPTATFVAAYLRAFVSFGPGESTGAIYQIIEPNTASLAFDLNALFPGAAGSNPHPVASTNFTDASDEAISGPLVGKVALGDIEVSEDNTTLYAVSLFDRRLYIIPFAAPDKGTRVDIPLDACVDPDDARPFALAESEGLIYVGLVCSAESTGLAADLAAAVYSFDPGTLTFSALPVLSFPLDYARGCADGDVNFPASGNCAATSLAAWQPWQDNASVTPAAPQPMLTDLVFDRGNMILGLRDRYGDQSAGAVRPAGDILRACGNGAGWTLESNANCGGINTSGSNNGQGPGPGPGPATGFGEYYSGDRSVASHAELSIGSLAQVPGFPDVLVTVYDPVFSGAGTSFDGGLRWLRNSNTGGGFATGETARSYRLYNDDGDFAPGDARFGKSNGAGDVEARCDPAPVQIGNRLWLDSNGNGIQDPGETPLADVTLQLYDADGALIGATVTDADGEWSFNFIPSVGDPDPNDDDFIAPDPYGIQVFIVIDPAEFGPGGDLEGLMITLANAGSGVNGTERDSDAGPVNVPGIGPRTGLQTAVGNPGENDHSLDLGFGAEEFFDFGDLPDNVIGLPDYDTLLSTDGARNAIVPGLFLGTGVDAEDNGQPTATADGDDLNGIDDENGAVLADLTLVIGSPSPVRFNATNTTGAAATLCGFVDFNADGDFADPDETAQVAVPNGSNNAQFTLIFNVPAVVPTGSYARFRLSTNALCAPSGEAPNGEVEDYPVTFSEEGPQPEPEAIPALDTLGLLLLSLMLAGAALRVLQKRRQVKN